MKSVTLHNHLPGLFVIVAATAVTGSVAVAQPQGNVTLNNVKNAIVDKPARIDPSMKSTLANNAQAIGAVDVKITRKTEVFSSPTQGKRISPRGKEYEIVTR